MKTFIERVRSGEPTRGTFLNLGSALAAEVCALSGFDWLLVTSSTEPEAKRLSSDRSSPAPFTMFP